MAGQSMRDIKRRITSIQNTQQITRAMEIVAATKLRRAQQQVLAARPFARKLQEVLERLVRAERPKAEAGGAGQRRRRGRHSDHPLLQARPVQRVAYVLITADRGLAGGYNANVIRLALDTFRREERPFTAVAIGRKGREALERQGVPILESYTAIGDEISLDLARRLASLFVTKFQEGEFDEVHLIYNMFVSAVVQRPVVTRLLPISGIGEEGQDPGPAAEGPAEDAAQEAVQYVYEPSPEAVLGILLPRYVDTQVYQALLEAKAAEHAARMTAMRNATDNAAEMIRILNLSFNRARQESITKEISEIVGGAEALAAR